MPSPLEATFELLWANKAAGYICAHPLQFTLRKLSAIVSSCVTEVNKPCVMPKEEHVVFLPIFSPELEGAWGGSGV